MKRMPRRDSTKARLPIGSLLVLSFALACGASESSAPALPSAWLAEPVDAASEGSPLRYLDTGLVSLNGVCPVQGHALNPIIPPVYVNGRPIGFC